MANLAHIENLFMGRLQRFEPLPSLQEAIVKNSTEILDINRAQLDDGEDAKGRDLGEYSNWYADIKGRKSPIDLKDTGSYRNQMYLEIDDKETRIKTRDRKGEDLKEYVRKKTGDEPLGIAPKNLPKVGNVVRPEFIQSFRNAIG